MPFMRVDLVTYCLLCFHFQKTPHAEPGQPTSPISPDGHEPMPPAFACEGVLFAQGVSLEHVVARSILAEADHGAYSREQSVSSYLVPTEKSCLRMGGDLYIVERVPNAPLHLSVSGCHSCGNKPHGQTPGTGQRGLPRVSIFPKQRQQVES